MNPHTPRYLLAAMLFCAASSSVLAQPRLSMGVASYSGTGGSISLPVTFTNDGTVRAVQFDIQYPQGTVDFSSTIDGAVLSDENVIYSGAVNGAPVNWVQRRVIVTPTNNNALLNTGELVQISLLPQNPPAINGIAIKVTNVILADFTAKAVAANTCAIGGFIYNPTDTTRDTDGDGLTNVTEAEVYSTNPGEADSDCDVMTDGFEVAGQLNPLLNDANGDQDGDGVSNLVEFNRGANPLSSDTDNDGLTDGFEIATVGFNPLDPADGKADWDGDGLTNAKEHWFGSNMNNADSDGDGVNDYVEYQQYVGAILTPIIQYLLNNDQTGLSPEIIQLLMDD